MAIEEQVLVVERSLFQGVGAFQGLSFDVAPYLERFFAPGAATFIQRPRAELDPSFKQLIPYVILAHEGHLLSYVRGKRAGETRLIGRRSIGIGGHVNPIDDLPLLQAHPREMYQTAVAREVAEEVTLDERPPDRVVALPNDDSTEVGRVHLGIVHYWSLRSGQVAKREQMMTQMTFMSPAELHADRESLETWSQICLDHLAELAERAKDGPRPSPAR